MVRGQSISSSVNSLINLIGKAMSGALVAFLGVPLIIIFNGISYLFSAFTEMFIHVPKTKRQGEKVTVTGILNDFKIAIRAIFSNRFLRLFIPSALLLNLLGSGPMTLLMPFVLEKGFTVEMYGFLMAIETAASLICVCILGIVKLNPKIRYYGMSIGFISSVLFYIWAYLSKDFSLLCILSFIGCFGNTIGNAVFNASLMLALPEESRGSILGFVSSASTGGSALSSVIFGLLCDAYPIYLVFVIGNVLSLAPMIYLCLHRDTKEFVLSN